MSGRDNPEPGFRAYRSQSRVLVLGKPAEKLPPCPWCETRGDIGCKCPKAPVGWSV